MMSPWEGLNRRRFPRVNYPCLVTVWVDSEGEKETFLTHTENIGIGGVCLTANKRFKLFSPIDIELDLLDMEDHLRCKGKVVWLVQRKDPDPRRPMLFDLGIEFEDIGEEEQRRISKIVQHLQKHQE